MSIRLYKSKVKAHCVRLLFSIERIAVGLFSPPVFPTGINASDKLFTSQLVPFVWEISKWICKFTRDIPLTLFSWGRVKRIFRRISFLFSLMSVVKKGGKNPKRIILHYEGHRWKELGEMLDPSYGAGVLEGGGVENVTSGLMVFRG